MIWTLKKYYKATTIAISNYMGVSLSTINSIIANRRTFNLRIINKCMLLHKVLNLKTPVTKLSYVISFIREEEQKSLFQLEKLAQKTTKSLENRQRTFLQQQENRQTWLRGFNACMLLQDEHNLPDMDKKWVAQRKRHLTFLLSKNSYVKEIKLQSEIIGLQAKLNAVQIEIDRLHGSHTALDS